jgi:phage tail protein X
MDLMTRVLRRLIPIPIGTKFQAMVDAIAASVEAAKATINDIIIESNPGTSDTTLRQWYAELSLKYDQTLPLATRQALARQAFISIGGQSLDVLNDAIAVAFPDAFLEVYRGTEDEMCGEGECGDMECSTYPSWVPDSAQDGTEPYEFYLVSGELLQPEELTALKNLLDRIAPAEMEPVFTLQVAGDTDTSQCGVAVCGLAECGAE